MPRAPRDALPAHPSPAAEAAASVGELARLVALAQAGASRVHAKLWKGGGAERSDGRSVSAERRDSLDDAALRALPVSVVTTMATELVETLDACERLAEERPSDEPKVPPPDAARLEREAEGAKAKVTKVEALAPRAHAAAADRRPPPPPC